MDSAQRDRNVEVFEVGLGDARGVLIREARHDLVELSLG